MVEYVKLKSLKSSPPLWVHLSCDMLAPPRCIASLSAFTQLRKTLLQRAERQYPPAHPARPEAVLCSTKMAVLCQRSQDTKIRRLWATRQSPKSNSFQARAV